MIDPCHGEGDDNEQGDEFVGMGDVGILDIEATGPGIGEQALDTPSALSPLSRTGWKNRCRRR